MIIVFARKIDAEGGSESARAWRIPHFLSNESDEFVRLIRRYENEPKHAAAPSYQDILRERSVHQMESRHYERSGKRDEPNV